MNPQTEIDILKLEKALAELDADWFRRQDSFKVHSRGRDYIPNYKVLNVLLSLLIVAIVGWIVAYIFSFVRFDNLLIGLVVILVAAINIFWNRDTAKTYLEQKAIYNTQRENLLLKIQKLKSLV